MFVNTWRLARFAVRCYTHPPFLELLAWQKCRSGWRRLLLLLLLLLLRAHAQSRGDLLALPSLADCACWKVAAMFNFFAARLCMLACEIKGRWKDESLRLIAQLDRQRDLRACAASRSREPGLVQAMVGSAQHCCATPHAGTTSAEHFPRCVPACAQLLAGALSHCSSSRQRSSHGDGAWKT